MDQETVSMILHGCRLAKEFEQNLPSMINQPNMVSNSCEKIREIFADARDRINVGFLVESQPAVGVDASSSTQAMNMTQAQALAQSSPFYMLQAEKAASGLQFQELGSNQMTSNAGKEVLSFDMSDPNKGSSSSERKRRRKEDAEKRIERVPVPRMGNIEIPLEDGHTWKKYGQKEILCSRFPRAYYRCTHQRLIQCPAKKQIQRMDDNPYMFEVTYLGDHTCHISSTAPSISVAEMTHEMSQSMSVEPLPASLSRWLSGDIPITGDSGVAAGQSIRLPEMKRNPSIPWRIWRMQCLILVVVAQIVWISSLIPWKKNKT